MSVVSPAKRCCPVARLIGWVVFSVIFAVLAPPLYAQTAAAQRILARVDGFVPGGRASIVSMPQLFHARAAEGFNEAYAAGLIPNQQTCYAVAREVVDHAALAAGFQPAQVAAQNEQWAQILSGTSCRATPIPPINSDIATARSHIDFALNAGSCKQAGPCTTWNRTVQVRGIPVLVLRNWTPAGDMILRAKAARMVGENALALALVASTQAHNGDAERWLDSHQQAVLAVLDELSFQSIRSNLDAWSVLRSVFPLATIP